MRLTPEEKFELVALVGDAWDARGDDRLAGCAAIVEWYYAVPFMRARRWRWRRQARIDRLVALLRETDPERLGRRA